jgi:hypothetical protein
LLSYDHQDSCALDRDASVDFPNTGDEDYPPAMNLLMFALTLRASSGRFARAATGGIAKKQTPIRRW